MTVNAAFANRTTDGVSSGFAMETDTAVVVIHNDSTMGGASVIIECASQDASGKYVPLSYVGVLSSAQPKTITLKAGMFLRVRQVGSSSSTSISTDIVT